MRKDHEIIARLIAPGSRVLDLGCGDGTLLELLTRGKNVRGQGIELRGETVRSCIEKGLSVFQGDIDGGLKEYPDKSFDYVILNQSMQEVKHAGYVLNEALRVGGKVIVGFPNFAYIKARWTLFFRGRTPITKSLPYLWYNTPNLHFLSITDFASFCGQQNISIVNTFYFRGRTSVDLLPNLLASDAIFVISKTS